MLRSDRIKNAMKSWRAMAKGFFTERVILLVGWVLFLVYAFPGYMSADSVQQLNMARHNEPLTDWHPPMMAFIWRFLDKIIAGPVLMLALQSLAFLLGMYVLLSRVMSKRAAALTAAILLLLPQNIIVMAVIWKDSQMAGFLVAAVAALLSERRRWRIVGFVFLFFATAVRYNAAAPTLPLILVLWDWGGTSHWLKRYGLAAVAWLAITVSAFLINGLITDRKVKPWAVGAASVDIIGTLRFAEDVDLDQLVRETPDVPWAADRTNMRERIVRSYRPENAFIYEFEGPSAFFNYPVNSVQREAIGKLWWRVVREHPAEFFKHRRKVLGANLKANTLVWHQFTPYPEADDSLQHRASASFMQRHEVSVVKTFVRLGICRPHTYWILSFILLCFTRRNRLAFALLASGIVHELGLLAIAPSVDYRYNHWMVLTTIMSIVLLVAERLRDRRVKSSANPAGATLVPDAPQAGQ